MANKGQLKSQEENLKKVIGLGGAMSISAGQVIGAGIMALTGIGIGLTGGSVVLSFILAAILTIFMTMPIAVMGASVPTTGGLYRYTSRLLSPKMGFFYLLLFLLGQITIAMYAISFADYLQGLVPNVPVKMVALGILTLLYILNLFGVDFAAKIQGVMVSVLVASIIAFIIGGIPKVNLEVFSGPTLFTGGAKGFFVATALLTFATSGAIVIAEMGGEMKNPGRDIPLAIITTTICIGILYAFMSTIAVAVLPLEEVAFQPLTNVARAILSKPLFLFFVIGGAMTALATTLNATFSHVTKGLLIACADGWLPKSMGKVNEKYGTPHYLLTIFYIVGAVPIVSGLSLEFISKLGNGAILIANLLPVISAYMLPKKYPEAYENSKFKFSEKKFKIIVVVAAIIQGIQGYFLISDLPSKTIIMSACYMLLVYIYCHFTWKKGKISLTSDF
ncbi:APC family permease [Anaeromicrobium sediminis]|uniref:Amino acid transporter n=1 Tax=Anaeromicrobium sediminis TaxID=1478221 RepID=A0A267MAK3_9FIRM|nr:APC family permease [Anaeromicrobium sediminis]PAB55843.1 amino acid transporter [Anaeromicrobium sediminis]